MSTPSQKKVAAVAIRLLNNFRQFYQKHNLVLDENTVLKLDTWEAEQLGLYFSISSEEFPTITYKKLCELAGIIGE